MTWKRSLLWFVLVLAAGWAVWLFKVLSPPGDFVGRYARAPACANGAASPACKQRVSAAVGGKTNESSYHVKKYALALRASDNAIVDVTVPKAVFEAVKTGDTVEIERFDGRVTKVIRDGSEYPQLKLRASKGKTRAAFAFLAALTVFVIARTLRARKRELAKVA